MNLDEFIAKSKADDCLEHIDLIRDEFVKLGCEKHLLKRAAERDDAERDTRRILNEVAGFTPSVEVEAFLSQFSEIEADKVWFVFPEEKNNYRFTLASAISELAEKTAPLRNIFDDDRTKNTLAVFDPGQTELIGMMHCVLHTMGPAFQDVYGGYKLYGKSPICYAEFLEHDGVVLMEDNSEGHRIFPFYCGWAAGRDVDPFLIVECRKKIRELVERGLFQNELDIYLNFYLLILPTFQDAYLKSRKIYDENRDDWHALAGELYSDLSHDGLLPVKWRAESKLFSIVRDLYPDALFQYSSRWLVKQRLDIYIPSVKLAIEYQGSQHYHEADTFGGADGLRNTTFLDEKKRAKCRENGVYLLEWPYSFSITRRNVQRKISEFLRENGLDGQMSLLDLLI